MIEAVQEILHGIAGQLLILDVLEGRPSSVTSCVVVEATDDDDGPTESAITGSPAVETNPNTTLSAAAGTSQTDPTACTLTSSVGVAVDRTYQVRAAAGHNEVAEVLGVTGSVAQLRTPLINDYPSGSSFVSTRITATVDTTWASNNDNLASEESTAPRFRAIWTYVLDGVTVRQATSFDLVRYRARHNVTPLLVDRRFPGWLDLLPIDYRRDQGRSLIASAFTAVKMDLRADAKLVRWARHTDVVSELVATRANELNVELAVMRGTLTMEALESARLVYGQRYKQLVREPKTSLAVQSKGGEQPEGARRVPLFRR